LKVRLEMASFSSKAGEWSSPYRIKGFFWANADRVKGSVLCAVVRIIEEVRLSIGKRLHIVWRTLCNTNLYRHPIFPLAAIVVRSQRRTRHLLARYAALKRRLSR